MKYVVAIVKLNDDQEVISSGRMVVSLEAKDKRYMRSFDMVIRSNVFDSQEELLEMIDGLSVKES